jgi:tetratricopeptide (TPR) repeat protein
MDSIGPAGQIRQVKNTGEKVLEQVPVACGALYQNGLAALGVGDAIVAISFFTQALEMEPGFVDCRQALRCAQKKAAEKKSGCWARFFRKGRLSPTLSKAELLLHLQPLATISVAEQVLNSDPDNVTAHKLLAHAALAANLPRTAILSLEALPNKNAYHRSIKLELAEAFEKSGQTSIAARIYGQLLKDNPEDRKVWRALKNISPSNLAPEVPASPVNPAQEALPTPSSQAATLLPSRPKNPQAPVSTDDAIIKRFEPLLVHCEKNTTILKKLAEAYARKMMFDKALLLYQRALIIAGGKNAAIEAAMAEIALKRLDQRVTLLDPKAPDYAAQREQLQNRRLEYQWKTMAAAH